MAGLSIASGIAHHMINHAGGHQKQFEEAIGQISLDLAEKDSRPLFLPRGRDLDAAQPDLQGGSAHRDDALPGVGRPGRGRVHTRTSRRTRGQRYRAAQPAMTGSSGTRQNQKARAGS